jgi:hypothetical protein
MEFRPNVNNEPIKEMRDYFSRTTGKAMEVQSILDKQVSALRERADAARAIIPFAKELNATSDPIMRETIIERASMDLLSLGTPTAMQAAEQMVRMKPTIPRQSTATPDEYMFSEKEETINGVTKKRQDFTRPGYVDEKGNPRITNTKFEDFSPKTDSGADDEMKNLKKLTKQYFDNDNKVKSIAQRRGKDEQSYFGDLSAQAKQDETMQTVTDDSRSETITEMVIMGMDPTLRDTYTDARNFTTARALRNSALQQLQQEGYTVLNGKLTKATGNEGRGYRGSKERGKGKF